MGKPQPHKTRPMLISFTTVKMRDYIYTCRRNLKGVKVYISEDCPKEIIKQRKQLLPALLGAKKLKKKAYFKFGILMVDGTACSDEEIAHYSKGYTESLKRRRPVDSNSPTSMAQEVKKTKNTKSIVSGIWRIERPRSLSLCNSPSASNSKQITEYFGTAPVDSPNCKTIFVQSESDK